MFHSLFNILMDIYTASNFCTHLNNAAVNTFGHKAFSIMSIFPTCNRFLEEDLLNQEKNTNG